MDEMQLFYFDGGVGDILEVYEDKVIIKHKGILNFFAMGIKGDKTIYYANLSSVEFKRAGLVSGRIQFSLLGGRESIGGALSASSDENTITFAKSTLNEEAEQIAEFINKKIGLARSNGPSMLSSADELKKFKDLLDAGIISQAEFDAKKKQILGV